MDEESLIVIKICLSVIGCCVIKVMDVLQMGTRHGKDGEGVSKTSSRQVSHQPRDATTSWCPTAHLPLSYVLVIEYLFMKQNPMSLSITFASCLD